MKKKNIEKVTGFTLIELLAVIVILAIIALISTPIIIGVIEKARKGAFEDSAYGVLDAGRVYFVDKLADDNKFTGASFTFPEGRDLKISGEKPGGGTFTLDTDGKSAMAIYDKEKKWCATKSYDEEKITIKDYKEEECKIKGSSSNTASMTIVNKNVEGNTDGLFTDDFGNTRYRGNDSVVKNYVNFNNEVWRIIGVFDGKVKVLKEEPIPNPSDGTIPYNSTYPNEFYWDNSTIENGAETDEGKNDWTTTYLNQYLNDNYYNSLINISKNMIEENKYHLGGIMNVEIDKKSAYLSERGITVYEGRPTEWIGKIGLIYASDYGYASGTECPDSQTLRKYISENCKNNNWIYRLRTNGSDGIRQLSITPIFTSASYITYINGSADFNANASKRTIGFVRPSVYLKSSVKITSGDGTSSNPYQLSI